MKICLVNKSYSDKIWDGISAYTHFLTQGLSDKGHEVHIITRSGTKNSQQDERQVKIWIHKVKLFKKLGKFNDLLYGLKVYFKFKAIDKKYGIDIVEAPEAGAEGFWLSIFARKKLVTRLHTPLYLCWKFSGLKLNWSRRLLNFMEKTQTKKSTLLSCPTQSLADTISRMWQISKDRIEVISNPFYLTQPKNYPPIKTRDYLLCLGRVEKIQGVDVLIKALGIVLKKYPKLQTVCVGGIDKDYFNKQLKSMRFKIKKNLVFTGGVNHDQVLTYIKQARLIVLPVLWENFPYKLLEAMGAGKTVITTNRGGFKEIIKNGQNGFLVKPGSHLDLAKKIIECLRLDKKKIQYVEENAQKTVLEFSLKKVIPKMINFYSKLKFSGIRR